MVFWGHDNDGEWYTSHLLDGEIERGGEVKYSSDIEDTDFYLVGSCICYAVGGNTTGAFLLACAILCFFGKTLRSIANES